MMSKLISQGDKIRICHEIWVRVSQVKSGMGALLRYEIKYLGDEEEKEAVR